MERVMGTISDGDHVVARDVSILLLEAGSPGDGRAAWQGQFDLPFDAMSPHLQRFYRLHTSDGRTGQIIFVGTNGTESHPTIRHCFRTSGPFD